MKKMWRQSISNLKKWLKKNIINIKFNLRYLFFFQYINEKLSVNKLYINFYTSMTKQSFSLRKSCYLIYLIYLILSIKQILVSAGYQSYKNYIILIYIKFFLENIFRYEK